MFEGVNQEVEGKMPNLIVASKKELKSTTMVTVAASNIYIKLTAWAAALALSVNFCRTFGNNGDWHKRSTKQVDGPQL